MKKPIVVALAVILILITVGCDGLVTEYDYAIIRMPDGEIKKVEVASVLNFSGGRIKITSKDGRAYMVSSINAVLVKEAD
jgi:hypothetical protein